MLLAGDAEGAWMWLVLGGNVKANVNGKVNSTLRREKGGRPVILLWERLDRFKGE